MIVLAAPTPACTEQQRGRENEFELDAAMIKAVMTVYA